MVAVPLSRQPACPECGHERHVFFTCEWCPHDISSSPGLYASSSSPNLHPARREGISSRPQEIAMPMFRGKPACDCQVQWLPAYERELLARRVIKFALDIYQLIGGAPQSGGTHVEGGAADTGQTSDEAIWVARQMGADAGWKRPKGWDNGGGIEHAHLVLRGCPHNGPARYQIVAVDGGFNGLGKNGQGGPDDGPRPLSGRSWQQGIAWQLEQDARRSAIARINVRIKTVRANAAAKVVALKARRKALL
jgi:hypothetical protein